MSDKHKHLEFLQGVITRMANNSFLIKGWTIALVSALAALAVDNQAPLLILVATLPVLVMWALDGFFLSQERRYRSLYDAVRVKRDDDIDFSNPPVA